MPEVIGIQTGPAWGCTCPAFRPGKPSPETVFKAMMRAADVIVQDYGIKRDTFHHFRAWTNPENKYSVTFNHAGGGGFCKHAAACSGFLAGGWLWDGYMELKERSERCQKNKRRMKQEIRKLTRSAKK